MYIYARLICPCIVIYFSIDTCQEKAKDKVKEKLDKCNKEKLLEFCDLFDISVGKATRKKKVIMAPIRFFCVAALFPM